MNRPTKVGIGIVVASTALTVIFGTRGGPPGPVRTWEGRAPARTYNVDRVYEIPATQEIRYRFDGHEPRNLRPTIRSTRNWMDQHDGPYRLRHENSMEWSMARTEQQTIDVLHRVLQHMRVGERIQIRAESDKTQTFILKKDLDPTKIIDTDGTQAIDIIVGTTIFRFPNLNEVGIYVCRPIAGSNTLSQHAFSNAVDWMGSTTTLNAVAMYQLRLVRAGYLPASQILWKGRDLISGHSVYNHYNHIHDSGKPLLSGSCRRAA